MESKFLNKIYLILLFLFVPFLVQATVLDFNIDPDYDYIGRSEVSTFLHQLGNNAYYYIEDSYYQNLNMEERKEFTKALSVLSGIFDETIYPQMTETYGTEWKPGIDEDEKITVLLTQIKDGFGGYFYPGDEYPKAQVQNSNEREMVYLNVDYIVSHFAESYLAHEFMHLITHNQKDRKSSVSDEVWLNEGRAEYASSLLGFDDDYINSYLQKRVKTFTQNPEDSITEWKEEVADYGALNLFMQYFVDHYGIEVLADSLSFEEIGIVSLNKALKKRGFSEDFAQVFTNWTIAVLINDCSFLEKYCYLNPNLKNLRITPELNYLPLVSETTLTVTDYIKDWSGNWIRLVGGEGKLKLEFAGTSNVVFKVPYILQDIKGDYTVRFLNLDDSQSGVVYISNFGKQYTSLTIVPSAQKKLSGFDGLEKFHKFLWSVSVINENPNEEPEENEELIAELLVQIEFLQKEIARIQALIAVILNGNQGGTSCSSFDNNLSYGLTNNQEVRCLQEFLKSQGAEIYPESLVTGNFLGLTEKAITRFQEKYRDDILIPLSLEQGTGFVGAKTRAKINELLGK